MLKNKWRQPSKRNKIDREHILYRGGGDGFSGKEILKKFLEWASYADIWIRVFQREAKAKLK